MTPLLLLGTPLDVNPSLPSVEVMRRAIAHTMATAVVPETCRTGNAVANKWEKLKNNPEDLVAKKPDIGWPMAEPSQAVKGKDPFSFSFTYS